MCTVTFPTLYTSSSGEVSAISWLVGFSATQGHPPFLPFPFMVLYSAQYQRPPCSENKHFPPFCTSCPEMSVGPSMWENTKSKSSAQNIAAPSLLPRGNIEVCATSGATPKHLKALQNLPSDSQAGSRQDPQAAFPAPGTRPAFKLFSSGSFHPERAQFPSPGVTGILLKLFCQHPDQAGLSFNDIVMLLLHSYKDCFDTSRIFDSLVKIKYRNWIKTILEYRNRLLTWTCYVGYDLAWLLN